MPITNFQGETVEAGLGFSVNGTPVPLVVAKRVEGTTPVAIFSGGTVPAALTVTFVQLITANGTTGVYELYGSGSTKAFVVKPSIPTGSIGLVFGATSILSAGIASGGTLYAVANNANSTGILVIGLETVNSTANT